MIPGVIRDPKAWLSEVFISTQGEAAYQGERQLFLRFGVCPLRCRYCDQPEALVKQDRFRIEKSPGAGEFLTYKNPVHPGGLWQILQRYRDGFPALHSVSLTGGEPVLNAEFINELAPFLRMAGLRIFLETAGVHVAALQKIRARIDIISMDLKTPSTTGEASPLEAHRAFLLQAREKSDECYGKIVVGETTSDEEIADIGNMLAAVAPEMRVYLQELWPVHPDDRPPTPATLNRLEATLRGFIPNVHRSRQQHKLDGIL